MSTDASKGRDELLIGSQWALRRLIQQGWQKEYCSWRTEMLKVSELNKDHGACRQVVKTSGCDSDMRGFESHQAPQLDV